MAKKEYRNLMGQITKLTKQAEQVRKAEIAAAIDGIKKKMAQFGLTTRDLVVGVSANTSTTTKRTHAFAPRRKPEPKYKDPISGKTWAGRGKTPVWMRESLNQGETMEKFAVNS